VAESKNPIDASPLGEEKRSERRRSRRVKTARPVRVRPAETPDEHFEDFPTSVNASREGIYFLTRNAKYRAGMQVRVTFPFISPDNPMNCEYVAHVVRVEGVGTEKFGVAVELLSTIDAKTGETGPI
jgi:PilZ domain-containing protein